jgi:hypothetical protein
MDRLFEADGSGQDLYKFLHGNDDFAGLKSL